MTDEQVRAMVREQISELPYNWTATIKQWKQIEAKLFEVAQKHAKIDTVGKIMKRAPKSTKRPPR